MTPRNGGEFHTPISSATELEAAGFEIFKLPEDTGSDTSDDDTSDSSYDDEEENPSTPTPVQAPLPLQDKRKLCSDTDDSGDSGGDEPLITLKTPTKKKAGQEKRKTVTFAKEDVLTRKVTPKKNNAATMRVTPKKKARVSQLLPPKKRLESKTSSPQVHFALENPYNKTPPRSPAPPSAPASAPPAFARDPAHYWGAHTDMNKSVTKRYPVIHRNETVDMTAHSTSSSPYPTPTVHLTSHPPMTSVQKQRAQQKKTDALTIQAGIATSERDDREMARRLAESFEKDDRAFADQGRADHHYNEKAHANGSRAEDFPASGSFRSTSVSPRRMTVPFFPPSMYEGMDMDQFSLFFLVVSLLTVFRKRERTGKAE
jgi:hypothetical protein